jgi:hypothetical protein
LSSFQAVKGFGLRDYLLLTAVTVAHLEAVAQLPADFVAPVHVDVLLDALQAHVERDFRRALLYAAIAVEAFALQWLEAKHESARVASASAHRFLKLPLAGGEVAHKDPVYELLSAGDNFSRLLHERPLYLAGRSLLVDAPETYRRAVQLYATRNKIAHRGTAPADEKHFALSPEGSVDGLETAVKVFRWLGDTGPYVVSTKLLPVEDEGNSF